MTTVRHPRAVALFWVGIMLTIISNGAPDDLRWPGLALGFVLVLIGGALGIDNGPEAL